VVAESPLPVEFAIIAHGGGQSGLDSPVGDAELRLIGPGGRGGSFGVSLCRTGVYP